MLSDDVTVLNIKHKVLQEVAKLAYDKKLEEGKELLPFQMIPEFFVKLKKTMLKDLKELCLMLLLLMEI